MTGGEIVAGAAAAAGRAVGGSKEERRALLEEAKKTSGFQLAAQEKGDRLAMTQILINAVLKPLFWVARTQNEYFKDGGRFAEDLGHKLEGVPPEELTAPNANVAAQAIEGLAYSLEDENLKDMYLNLLSSASQKEQAEDAHPSFAGIIRQLSADEAGLLQLVSPNRAMPIVEVRATNDSIGQFRVLEPNLINVIDLRNGQPLEEGRAAMWIDNWSRLGLIEVSFSVMHPAPEAYDWVTDRPEYRRHAEQDLGEGFRMEFKRGLLTPTAFGRQFINVCVPAKD